MRQPRRRLFFSFIHLVNRRRSPTHTSTPTTPIPRTRTMCRRRPIPCPPHLSRRTRSSSSVFVNFIDAVSKSHFTNGSYLEITSSPCFRTTFRCLPTIAGQAVDLQALYTTVVGHGGWDKVNDRQLWLTVANKFGIDASCLNGTQALRNIYVR